MILSNQQLILLILVIIVLSFFYEYNNKTNIDRCAAENEYNKNNCYKNVSTLKHDIFKQLIIDLSVLIILGLITNKDLFDKENIFESIVGKSSLTILGFFVYYIIVQL